VVITGFKIFDTPYSRTDQGTIKLKYDQNYFSFDFVALNYTEPTHTTYAYILEGLDDKWNDAGTRRYVSYANLKEGSYTFKVRAWNNEGVGSQPATLHFVILPPFWHRWWFYGFIILFIASAVYLINWIRRKQFKSKEQLRNKIARDLHDDIGSTLSGINIFSKIALRKVHSDQDASSELLQKINERSSKTMEALSDIVWSINTRNDSMNNVLAKMREYLGEVLEPAGVQYEFMVDKAINHVHINMEMRKEMYLIFKEAVNNATKYAACSLMQVQLIKGFKSVILIIQDNGKGFDVNTIIPGNGIYNMKERSLKIKADITIQSEINKGTFIRLVLPITRNR
jgi:signal transduction histidine kinase